MKANNHRNVFFFCFDSRNGKIAPSTRVAIRGSSFFIREAFDNIHRCYDCYVFYAFCALHASSSLKIRNKNLNIFETWFHWSSIPLFHLPPSVWLLNDFFLCEKGFIFFFTNNNQHQIDHQPANIVNFRASRVLCVRTLAIRRIINSAWGSLREGTLRDGFPKKN